MIYLKLLLQGVAEDVRKTIKRTVCALTLEIKQYRLYFNDVLSFIGDGNIFCK